MAKSWARRSSRSPEVVAAIEAAAHGAPADFVTQSGWVLIALQNAFYQLLHAESAEEGIVATVMAGGDTDTNAVIAGALLGAVYGREAIPVHWRNLILSCRPLAGAPGVLRPRPSPFWPVDALELAERLLLSGA
jgi:ADP-ribosylglycohydrolase